MDRSLSTKYRPQLFEDLVGQENVKQILKKQIEEDNLRSAYLFVGAAGCGKTTSARCMARSINGSLVGLVEIDAASNSGVDSVRELTELSKFKPIGYKKKIYIIDECHSLSSAAFQAFLKTIEDGVKDVIFIFCTTERHKVPATIVSRCQVFEFNRINSEDIKKRLKFIQDSENKEVGEYSFQVTDGGLDYISKLANGGMRLAISMYEKVINCDTNPTLEDIAEILGTSSYKTMFSITEDIYNRDVKSLITTIEKLNSKGADFKLIMNDFVNFIIELTKFNYTQDYNLCSIPHYYLENYIPYESNFLFEVLEGLINCVNSIKLVDNPKNFMLGKLLQFC